MIVKIQASPLINKRYRAIMDNGKVIDFGFKNPKTGEYGSTYIDHNSGTLRAAYRKRHLANPIEKRLIDNLAQAPATLSYWILWGDYRTIAENVKDLNAKWAIKHSKQK